MNDCSDINPKIPKCPSCGMSGYQRSRLRVVDISLSRTTKGYLTKLFCLKCNNNFSIWQNPPTGEYAFIQTPKGRMLMHRWVWEEAYGEIPPGYTVHHLNGIKNDNRLENLAILPNRIHSPFLGNNGESNKLLLIKELKKRIRDLESRLDKQ